jgi:hypothetical protein
LGDGQIEDYVSDEDVMMRVSEGLSDGSEEDLKGRMFIESEDSDGTKGKPGKRVKEPEPPENPSLNIHSGED